MGSGTASPGSPTVLTAALLSANMASATLAGPTAQTTGSCGVAIAVMADVQLYSIALPQPAVAVLAGQPGSCTSPPPSSPPPSPPPPSAPTAPPAPPAPASLVFGGSLNTTCLNSLVHRIAVAAGQSPSVADLVGTWTPGLNGSATTDSNSASVALPGATAFDALLLNGNAGSSALALGATGLTVTAVLRLNATAPLEAGILLWAFSDAAGSAFAALWAVNAPSNASRFNLLSMWRSAAGAGAVVQSLAVGGVAAIATWHRVTVTASALGTLTVYVDGADVAVGQTAAALRVAALANVTFATLQVGGTAPLIPGPALPALVPWNLIELQVYNATIQNEPELFSGSTLGCTPLPATAPGNGISPAITNCPAVIGHRLIGNGSAVVDVGPVRSADGISPSLSGTGATFGPGKVVNLAASSAINLLAPGNSTTFRGTTNGYGAVGFTLVAVLNIPAPTTAIPVNTTVNSLLFGFSGAGGDNSYVALYLARTTNSDYLTMALGYPPGYSTIYPSPCTGTSTSTYSGRSGCLDLRPLAGSWLTLALQIGSTSPVVGGVTYASLFNFFINGTLAFASNGTGGNTNSAQYSYLSGRFNFAQAGGVMANLSAVPNQVGAPFSIAEVQLYYMQLPPTALNSLVSSSTAGCPFAAPPLNPSPPPIQPPPPPSPPPSPWPPPSPPLPPGVAKSSVACPFTAHRFTAGNLTDAVRCYPAHPGFSPPLTDHSRRACSLLRAQRLTCGLPPPRLASSPAAATSPSRRLAASTSPP